MLALLSISGTYRTYVVQGTVLKNVLKVAVIANSKRAHAVLSRYPVTGSFLSKPKLIYCNNKRAHAVLTLDIRCAVCVSPFCVSPST